MFQKRKIGVSAAPFFPWCLGREGIERTVGLAKRAGFDGLQILPLRGWMDFAGLDPKFVMSYTPEWNSGTWRGAFRRTLGLAGEECPLILDMVLFGSDQAVINSMGAIRSAFPEAIYVAKVPGTNPLEIHPEAGLTVDEYAQYPYPLIWDTWHSRRPMRYGQGGEITKNWQILLERVAAKICQIHVHPTIREIVSLVRGDPQTELIKMLRALGEKTVCPVVIEVAPLVFGIPSVQVALLRRIRKVTEGYLH
ncbi:MAG: hypothetical protein Q8N84_00350 [bacterium]|nr:hypothetical protein [bacterium]